MPGVAKIGRPMALPAPSKRVLTSIPNMIIYPHPVSTEGVVMRRLSMETAEDTGPDAAPKASGPAPGTPGQGRGGGPTSLCQSGATGAQRCAPAGGPSRVRPMHRPCITSGGRCVLQGRRGASLQHRARDAGGTGGPAVLSSGMPRCREASRSAGPAQACLRAPGPRCPAPPRTFSGPEASMILSENRFPLFGIMLQVGD
jgi:hypothetical protein